MVFKKMTGCYECSDIVDSWELQLGPRTYYFGHKEISPVIQACQTSAVFRVFWNILGHSCESSRSWRKYFSLYGGGGSGFFLINVREKMQNNVNLFGHFFFCFKK